MIKVESISFARGEHQIYRDFSAEVNPGEAVLLEGANGTGKSTLVALIGGVLEPDSGTITIDGSNIVTLSAKEQAQIRSVAPQRRTFSLAFTVKQVLNFLPQKHRVDDDSSIIQRLGLENLLNKKITELSIGQQERVSLALALRQRAHYYLLDEPFSAQDSNSTSNILELIADLKREKGLLVISHNQEALKKYFDRVITLS